MQHLAIQTTTRERQRGRTSRTPSRLILSSMETRLSTVTPFLACPKASMSTSERLKTRSCGAVQRTNSDPHILMMLKISLIRHLKTSSLSSKCVWVRLPLGYRLINQLDVGSSCRMYRRAGSASSDTAYKPSSSSLSSRTSAVRGRPWQWKTVVRHYSEILNQRIIQRARRRIEADARPA